MEALSVSLNPSSLNPRGIPTFINIATSAAAAEMQTILMPYYNASPSVNTQFFIGQYLPDIIENAKTLSRSTLESNGLRIHPRGKPNMAYLPTVIKNTVLCPRMTATLSRGLLALLSVCMAQRIRDSSPKERQRDRIPGWMITILIGSQALPVQDVSINLARQI